MARVGLIGENSIEYINKLLDIWNAGDCAVLIDWRIPYLSVIEMMIEAGVKKCFIEKRVWGKFSDKKPNDIEFIVFERNSNSAEFLPETLYVKFNENYSKNEAIVIYSSGTTGKAKGIILSHFALNTNADAIIDYMKLIENDCIYIAKTLSHSSTLTGELLIALKTRTKLVIAPIIVPPRYVLNNINKFDVTIICLNPTLLFMYTEEYQKGDYDLSSIRTIYISGSILYDKVYVSANKVFKNIPIYNAYGLSEAGPRVAVQCEDCCMSNSVGKPIKGVEIMIVDNDGNEVRQGEKGVIQIKSPSLFEGYAVGEKRFAPFRESWLNSGDIGYLDDNRELHIVDRIDDVIIIDSHKVYPSEVEKIIEQHPNIIQCAIIQVTYDSTIKMFCCYISNSNENINFEIYNMLCEKLSLNEIPDVFVNMDKLPKNNNDKIDKKILVQKVLKGEL